MKNLSNKKKFFLTIFSVLIIFVLQRYLKWKNGTAFSILSIVITLIAFFEELLEKISLKLFSKSKFPKEEIYKRVIKEIQLAKREILFMTPTISWGRYSAGLWVFEETINELKKAINRGVTVEIIYDMFDKKNQLVFLQAFKKNNIPVKLRGDNAFDYFLIRDQETLIVMTSENEKIKLEHLEIVTRPIASYMFISTDKKKIEISYNRFKQEFKKIKNNIV